MAASHGRTAVCKVTSGGTLRDISAYLTSTGRNAEADTAEVSTLGDTNKEYLAGLIDGSIPLEGPYDPTIDGYLNAILGGVGTAFEYYPAGTASGAVKYDGSAICTKYEISSDIGDANRITAELQITGPVTRATV